MAQLTAEEIAHYHRHGWVRPSFRLPDAQVTRMREALDDLIARNPGVRPEKLVSAHIEGSDDGGDNGEGVRGSKAFLQLAMDPQIVELVAFGAMMVATNVFNDALRVDLDGYLAPYRAAAT